VDAAGQTPVRQDQVKALLFIAGCGKFNPVQPFVIYRCKACLSFTFKSLTDETNNH